jgi:hypothetical protein
MFSFRALITASLALVGLTTAACLGSEGTTGSPDLFDDVPLESSEVAGHSGTNSLLVTSYLAEADSLLDLTTRRLKNSSPAGTSLINSSSAYIIGTPEGQDILDYAARCALADNDHVVASIFPTLSFYGSGILTTTAGWGSAALTNAQKEDLFTCVLTHLNPSGAEIDTYLKGPSVAADNSDGTVFDFTEAVWLTTVSAGPFTGTVVEHHVWPQQDLRTRCGPSLEGSLGTRVCGTSAGCGDLTIHTDADFAADCTGSDGSYTCLGKPAIQTKLKTVQLSGIHPKCT